MKLNNKKIPEKIKKKIDKKIFDKCQSKINMKTWKESDMSMWTIWKCIVVWHLTQYTQHDRILWGIWTRTGLELPTIIDYSLIKIEVHLSKTKGQQNV